MRSVPWRDRQAGSFAALAQVPRPSILFASRLYLP